MSGAAERPRPASGPSAGSGPAWRDRVTDALEMVSEAICFLDAEDRLTWLNSAAERLLERPAGTLVGRAVWAEFPELGRSHAAVTANREARRTGTVQHLEMFAPTLDRWFEVRVLPVEDDVAVFFRDVHERRALDDERAAESSLLRAVLNALPARTAILDADGTILTTNTAWQERRPPAGQVSGDRGDDYVALCRAAGRAGHRGAQAMADGLEALLAGRTRSFSLDHAWPGARQSGGETWWHMQAFPVDDGPRVVVTHTDITDRVSAEQRQAWQARHDHLTALPNRAGLHEAISAALAEEPGGAVTVLFMDVDGFKQVNDTLGHEAGDLLLRELASRLAHRTRPTDVVGRLGGDEFVVVARDCPAAGGLHLAERFRAVFDEPFELAGSRLPVTVSIGIASSGPGTTRPEDLLRDADTAMYAAKSRGPDRHLLFTPALRTELEERWQVASGLREAVLLEQFTLHWQPVVDLATDAVVGCEALLRWEHPERGRVPPAEFVPVAEEKGLIEAITRWLLRTAVEQGAAWERAGLPLAVGVNVSALHLASGTLVDDVLGALGAGRLAPRRLVVELTETSLTSDPEQAAAQLGELRRHGVRVAIDDFGTGYSSLATVAALPVDTLKVDRSLVSGLPEDRTVPQAVLGAVAALGTALGMDVLAEGVETPAQLAAARRVGCTHAQGFHLSRPLTAAELTPLLLAGRSRTGVPCLPAPPG